MIDEGDDEEENMDTLDNANNPGSGDSAGAKPKEEMSEFLKQGGIMGIDQAILMSISNCGQCLLCYARPYKFKHQNHYKSFFFLGRVLRCLHYILLFCHKSKHVNIKPSYKSFFFFVTNQNMLASKHLINPSPWC